MPAAAPASLPNRMPREALSTSETAAIDPDTRLQRELLGENISLRHEQRLQSNDPRLIADDDTTNVVDFLFAGWSRASFRLKLAATGTESPVSPADPFSELEQTLLLDEFYAFKD